MRMERASRSTGSLFERIREASKPPLRRHSKEAFLHSILSNLDNVLNTRSGSCCGSPELGIIDLNDDLLKSGEFRNKIKKAIIFCILRYEPRISDVKVMAVAEDGYAPLELRFHIVATMDFDTSKGVLEFDILLDDHQHWSVE